MNRTQVDDGFLKRFNRLPIQSISIEFYLRL